MISKRTIIGFIIGSAIIAIGIYTLTVYHLGTQPIKVDETFGLGESTSYHFVAPIDTPQTMIITGDTFDVTLQSPDAGLQIPLTSYKTSVTFDWVHLEDGDTRIVLQNTGNSEMNVEAIFRVSPDPIYITFDIMVIISGLVIMGFSLGFSVRKPRGF